uniref:Uncharacterized protein n=1 Tax=Salix viminalis TaxID=40686 RepID=A0A6N2MBZ3_SALVM
MITVLPLQECDFLRAIAKPRLQTSTVVDAKTGKGIESKVRTSTGMFLSSEEKKYPMVQFNLKSGGQRIATMLMYLSDTVEGGETYFPMAGSGNCSCGGKVVEGLSVKPFKGDAVLFWSMVCF